MDRWVNRLVDGWMDGRLGGCTGQSMDGRKYVNEWMSDETRSRPFPSSTIIQEFLKWCMAPISCLLNSRLSPRAYSSLFLYRWLVYSDLQKSVFLFLTCLGAQEETGSYKGHWQLLDASITPRSSIRGKTFLERDFMSEAWRFPFNLTLRSFAEENEKDRE